MENSKLKTENYIRYCIIHFVIYELKFTSGNLQITAAFMEGSLIFTHTKPVLSLFNLCTILLFMHNTFTIIQVCANVHKNKLFLKQILTKLNFKVNSSLTGVIEGFLLDFYEICLSLPQSGFVNPPFPLKKT